MADWRAVGEGINKGYLLGRDTGGGRVGQLGSIISKVADHLKKDRELTEAVNVKKNLLGYEGMIKGYVEPAKEGDQGGFDIPGLGKMKRTVDSTQEPIVDRTGKVTGYRPKGSVFEPAGKNTSLTLSGAISIISDPMKANQVKRKYPELYKQAEKMVTDSLNQSPTSSLEGGGLMDENW